MTRVDDDYVVAHIEKRRVSRIVFARQHPRHFGRQSADGFACRVHDEPFTVFRQTFSAWEVNTHNSLLLSFIFAKTRTVRISKKEMSVKQ